MDLFVHDMVSQWWCILIGQTVVRNLEVTARKIVHCLYQMCDSDFFLFFLLSLSLRLSLILTLFSIKYFFQVTIFFFINSLSLSFFVSAWLIRELYKVHFSLEFSYILDIPEYIDLFYAPLKPGHGQL